MIKKLVEAAQKDPQRAIKSMIMMVIMKTAFEKCRAMFPEPENEEIFIESLSVFVESRLHKDVDRERLREYLLRSHAEGTAELAEVRKEVDL